MEPARTPPPQKQEKGRQRPTRPVPQPAAGTGPANSGEAKHAQSVSTLLTGLVADPRYREEGPTGDQFRTAVTKGFELAYPGTYQPGSWNRDAQAAVSPEVLQNHLRAVMVAEEPAEAQAGNKTPVTTEPRNDGADDGFSNRLSAVLRVSNSVESEEAAASNGQDEQPDQSTPEGEGERTRGTVFYGGADMEGAYIEDMVAAFGEAGIENVRAADPDLHSEGRWGDVYRSIIGMRTRDDDEGLPPPTGDPGTPLNLIGYSYGSLKAAQDALDYADQGSRINNVVLIGSPISQELLFHLEKHVNIDNVIVVDLTEQGDEIFAGMEVGDILSSGPSVGFDFARQIYGDSDGHFHYSDESEEGDSRRRDLAKWLYDQGLR